MHRTVIGKLLSAFFMLLTLVLANTSAAQDVAITTKPDTTELPPWQVCNETSFVLKIAIAGVAKGKIGQPVSVWGWRKLRPGQCQTVEVETGTPRFIYAKSANFHQGGIREWQGDHVYCVGSKDFNINTDMDCAALKLKSAKFWEIVPTERHTALVEPDNYGRRAQTAGIQRLLKDANYNITRIDGQTGKRTSSTLSKFIRDHGLSISMSTDAKFAALEKAAAKAKKTTGVRLCNTSKAKMWAALAYKKYGGYEARGWWPIEKKSCIHPFSENIKGRDVHYVVRMESTGADRLLKTDAKSTRQFCVGPAKFSALRHEYCRDQGYIAARFKAVDDSRPGVKIDLSDSDFTKTSVSGLR